MQYPFSKWRWKVYDQVHKRRIDMRHRMTEEALKLYPKAETPKWSEMVSTGPSSSTHFLERQ